MRSGPRVSIVLLVAILAASSVVADGGYHENDAGSGADAGDTRASATPIALGATYGSTAWFNDTDWFVSSVPSSNPACITARVHADAPTYFALGAESGDETAIAAVRVTSGEEGILGVAGQTPLTTALRVHRAPSSSWYPSNDFRLDRSSIPATNGDGLGGASDAGDSTSAAMPIGPGCTGGHLALTSVDVRDMFAIQIPAGRVVTYSFAATVPGISLGLVDAVGNAVGPALEPGEVATASPPSGTYYLSAQRSTGVGDIGYLVGVIVGPEPSGCRPYCLD